jgi:putative transposase
MTKHYSVDESLTSVYFCTCTIVEWLCVFKEEKYFTLIIESLKYCIEKKGLIVFGYVIMPSHIHLMASHEKDVTLSDIMRDFKHYTSTKIAEMLLKDNNHLFLRVFQKATEGRSKKLDYKVWQDEYHPIAITSEKWFLQKMEYMHNNPVRKGFVEKPEDWKYSSARNWILDDDGIIIINREMVRG